MFWSYGFYNFPAQALKVCSNPALGMTLQGQSLRNIVVSLTNVVFTLNVEYMYFI